MLVDPEVLRAFAAQVDVTVTVIGGTNVGSVAATAADGLPGSETQWAAQVIGEHLGLAANDIATGIGAIQGSAVRGAGDRYEVDDAALAGVFKGLF